MTNVTKVVKPFYEGYLDRSAVEANILSGALFNVRPRSGQVRIYNYIFISIKKFTVNNIA